MILFSFAETPRETKPAWPNAPLRSWRWVFGFAWPIVGFERQCSFEVGDWGRFGSGHSYRIIGFGGWQWGMKHGYYDGPNCSLSLGPVQFAWQPETCHVCEGEGDAF